MVNSIWTKTASGASVLGENEAREKERGREG